MDTNSHEELNSLISNMKNAGILDTKKISDKWHTFGELYLQRVYLFSIICNQNQNIAWKSLKHYDEENDPMFNGDFIVGLTTPEGPASYHFKLEFWEMFEVPVIPNTSKEALKRFRSILYSDKEQKHKK